MYKVGKFLCAAPRDKRHEFPKYDYSGKSYRHRVIYIISHLYANQEEEEIQDICDSTNQESR